MRAKNEAPLFFFFGAACASVAAWMVSRRFPASRRLGGDLNFGDMSVGASHIFLAPPGQAVAFSGLNPIKPGHLIVVPRRQVARLRDLEASELLDLFQSVQTAQRLTEQQHGSPASNLALKDGGEFRVAPARPYHVLTVSRATNCQPQLGRR
jgi:hypothetical protein